MDFLELIKKRRSIRSFNQQKPVSKEQISQILEAGRWAPSAHNLQDWYFVVVKSQKTKEKLVGAAQGQSFLAEAQVVIVVCADLRLADRQSSRHGKDFYTLQDSAIATQNMWLEATALGLGACWIGAFDEEAVKNILKLADYLRPVALLPIGYAGEKLSPTPRRKLEEISREI